MLGRWFICCCLIASSVCAAPAATYYGTTEYGGATNHGTVFKREHGGPRIPLYSFCPLGDGYCWDGAHPVGNIVPLPDGSLVGTTTEGGNGAGTIFQLRFSTAKRWQPRIVWNVCWTFWQCDYYGRSDGTLQWMKTNKQGAFILDGVCDGPDGRGVFYSLTLGKTSAEIVPRDYWNHGAGDYVPLASVQIDL